MDKPILRVELQRHTNDCAVATLAMLLDVSYETVLAAVARVQPKVLQQGLTWTEIRKAAKLLGYKGTLTRKKAPDLTAETGALCVYSKRWRNQHLVAVKEGLIVDTDGCLYDADVYLSVNKAQVMGLMTFEPIKRRSSASSPTAPRSRP